MDSVGLRAWQPYAPTGVMRTDDNDKVRNKIKIVLKLELW